METVLKDFLYEFDFGPLRIRLPTELGDRLERRIWGSWGGKIFGKFAPLRKYLNERIWRIRLNPEDTLLRCFKNYIAIDMVALSHKMKRHKKERILMSDYFNYDVDEGVFDNILRLLSRLYYLDDKRYGGNIKKQKRMDIEREFIKLAWEGHRENKVQLFDALDRDYDLILFFTPLADLVGHLSFGLENKMREVYEELDTFVANVIEKIRDKNNVVIGISDHGMEQIVLKLSKGVFKKTRYGDHGDLKHGTYFINRTIEKIKEHYENRKTIFNDFEQYDIQRSLSRLEKGNPTLRDFHHIIKVYRSIPANKI
jgi:predicted AlkP superfamily pyrophosphatase or phosphodiesterase